MAELKCEGVYTFIYLISNCTKWSKSAIITNSVQVHQDVVIQHYLFSEKIVIKLNLRWK